MCLMPYPTKPKGGWQRPCQVVVNKSTAQIREKKATQKFANKYREIFQNNMAEGPKDPHGPFFYQEGGKTYASLPVGMLQNIQKSPVFEKMQKDCKAEGIELPKNIMAKDPITHVLTPQEYLQNVEARDNASDEQPQCNEGNGRKRDRERSDQVFDDGVLGFRASDPAQNTTTTKTQVTNVALQTDSCDTLYVTKNTLTAYTIAIVQNAQALQYDQMHVALQTARNQASLETPLRAEELMTTHFNLAVLSNETNINKTLDARNLKPLILMQNRLPQPQTRRPTLRYPVSIMLQIAIQRNNTLPELSPQPVDENTDSLTEYQQVMRLMTLGTIILILMSVSTHTHTT